MNAPKSSDGLTYADAGVDIDAGDALVERIKPLAKRTMRPRCWRGIGGFGALFEVRKGYREPVLVSGTDGVGTKLKLAFALDRHDTIGIDLVAMSVNDILVQGAEPLFFLDYFACGKLDVDVAAAGRSSGIAAGCEQAGCALIGGETAEMPGMYPPGEYDLAGFAVGVVEKTEIIDGAQHRRPATRVLGARLERAAFQRLLADPQDRRRRAAPTCDDAVRRPHARRRAARADAHLREAGARADARDCRVKGMAHITGGGLVENVPRVLPEARAGACSSARAGRGRRSSTGCSSSGNVADAEMHRVFNCGIGMVVVVGASDAERALAQFKTQGEQAWKIGTIRPRAPDAAACIVL